VLRKPDKLISYRQHLYVSPAILNAIESRS
jgi:hypothetical protein